MRKEGFTPLPDHQPSHAVVTNPGYFRQPSREGIWGHAILELRYSTYPLEGHNRPQSIAGAYESIQIAKPRLPRCGISKRALGRSLMPGLVEASTVWLRSANRN